MASSWGGVLLHKVLGYIHLPKSEYNHVVCFPEPRCYHLQGALRAARDHEMTWKFGGDTPKREPLSEQDPHHEQIESIEIEQVTQSTGASG